MRRFVLGLVISSLSLFAVIAHGQAPSAPQKADTQYSYVPDLGDIMETMQLRHFKLSYAGQLKNWTLANFELMQIQKSFDVTAKLYPDFANVDFAKLISQLSKPALARVGEAIKAQDSAAFAQAFGALTHACDNCHQAAGFGFIVIRVPTASPFSNQLFPPNRE